MFFLVGFYPIRPFQLSTGGQSETSPAVAGRSGPRRLVSIQSRRPAARAGRPRDDSAPAAGPCYFFAFLHAPGARRQIAKASGRERVGPYASIPVVAEY